MVHICMHLRGGWPAHCQPTPLPVPALLQVVVDAGTKNNRRQSHATNLVKAVQAAIPAGERVAAIACALRQRLAGGSVLLCSCPICQLLCSTANGVRS